MRECSVDDLTPDPQNARKHTEANLSAIERSLARVGPARSIVIDEDGVVLAGNATLEAAKRAGITKVRIFDSDGHRLVAVRVPNLSEADAIALAVADNRAAELAAWNPDVLKALQDDAETAGVIGDHWHPFELLGVPPAAGDMSENLHPFATKSSRAVAGFTWRRAERTEYSSGKAGAFQWPVSDGKVAEVEQAIADGRLTAADLPEVITRVRARLFD